MSLNERLVEWLRRAGRANRTVVDLLIAAALIGLIGAVAFGMPAHAQTATPPPDRMITVHPMQWTNRVVDVQASPFRACVAGYHREADRYGGWMVAIAWVDFARLSAAQIAALSAAASNGDLIALGAMRTVTAGAAQDPAAAPCRAKLVPPPPVWRVAPIASGHRPLYVLGPDRKRGAAAGSAPVATTTGGPTPCNCKIRSVETTSSTYCALAAGPPTQVTLCRESK